MNVINSLLRLPTFLVPTKPPTTASRALLSPTTACFTFLLSSSYYFRNDKEISDKCHRPPASNRK